MRKQELSNGKTWDVRALTGSEIRAGKEFGLKYLGIRIEEENFDAALDYCLGCQFNLPSLNDLSAPDLRALFRAVITETWGDPGEEKNSPTSGPGAQTPKEALTAATADPSNANRG